ncbi:lytic transglycosylase domain-containing protein [Snodgrassella sp. ESL0323]|uniref:lytic transglycosylase domain-containing protein n=1 Tax=Snodgrassella TaxID=1193515 RepID=UPI0004D80DD9|nr:MULTISPECIES: lytic transglycosylase domain-containing protein [Snodgrassella]KES10028.1 Soluble lytic murein transglycosylase or related regulatory protein [Snodgrassella alvi SCGC AB-598-O11]NUF79016.1 lytic transglycosylase domain-containing protein [Snodgrassella sp. ESL0323]
MPYRNKSVSRRRLLQAGSATLLGMAIPRMVLAGAQREETLSDDVASIMRNAVNNANPPRLIFSSPAEASRWLNAMSSRLASHIPDDYARKRLLTNIQYESMRAGLDTQVILGLIEVESRFRQYAISGVGARGLMQVMPFWVKQIGRPEHNLFDIRTNLRYGCTILRYYRNRENGNMVRALARYNGSLGRSTYSNAVINAWQRHWQWA